MKKAVVIALAALMVLSVAAVAFADVETFSGTTSATNAAAPGPVTVKATVNPKITLTVDTPDAGQSVEWLSVDPDTTVGGKTVGLLVSSNKAFDLSVAKDTTAFAAADITLTTTLANQSHAKGKDVSFSDDYSITTTWDTEPGTYNATVTYTVTQQ